MQEYAFKDQMKSIKGEVPQLLSKGNQIILTDRRDPFWNKKTQGVAFSMDLSLKYDEWNVKRKKWRSGRESPDLKLKSRASSIQLNDRLFHSEFRAKSSQENIRGKSIQNRGRDMEVPKGVRMFAKSEETESDSSEKPDEGEDSNPLMRSKSVYSSGAIGSSQSSFLKSGPDPKNAKFVKKNKRESAGAFDAITSSKKIGNFGEELHMPEVSLKTKQKGKVHDRGHLHSSASGVVEDNYYSGAGTLNDNGYRKITNKVGKNEQSQWELGDRLQMPSLKFQPAERRQKVESGRDHSIRHASYLHNYAVDPEDDSLETRVLGDDNGQGRMTKKSQSIQSYPNGRDERSDALLVGCNRATKKRKGKEETAAYTDGRDDYDYLKSEPQYIDDSPFSKKRERVKVEADSGSVDRGTSEPPATEAEVTDPELETKPQKKPFTLITPTVHTGFSFSIIHLLSSDGIDYSASGRFLGDKKAT